MSPGRCVGISQDYGGVSLARVRGLLVVNPRATTTSPGVTDVLVHALAGELDLDVVITTHKGHGQALGERALDEQLDLVITLGGDGTINEVVNGLLRDGPGPQVPLLATVPGGSGNVFPRAIGLPNDAIEATAQILAAVRTTRTKSIGLGMANDRWFVVNAGVGLDAEIIASMEEHRKRGRTASPLRYLTTTLTEFFARTNRKEPALTIQRPHYPDVDHVFLAIVQNTSPWTYFGPIPLDPCPAASFDTGLDVFAVRRLGVGPAIFAARRLLMHSPAGSTRKALKVLHDQPEFTIRASRVVEVQVDGERIGGVTELTFRSVPHSLRVLV